MAPYQFVKLERRESVAVLTLNRPDTLNSWNAQMRAEMQSAIRVRNRRAFCSSLDSTLCHNSGLRGKPGVVTGTHGAATTGLMLGRASLGPEVRI